MTNLVMNDQLKGIELYFEGKPNQTVISSLKGAGFRFHGGKVCWYAKQSEKTMVEAQKYITAQADQAEEKSPLALVSKIEKVIKNNILSSLWDLTRFTELEVDKKLDTKAIAAEARKHARSRFPMVKFSVTSTYSSISFHIMSSPYEKESSYLNAIQNYCTKFLESYNYCTSYDPYGDYGSSYSFYGARASIDYDYTQTEQTEAIKKDMLEFDTKNAESEKVEEDKKEADFQLYLIKQAEEKISHQERQTEEQRQVQEIYNSITVTDITEGAEYFVIGSEFAHMNKVCTLDEYKEEVKQGEFELQTVKINKEVHFQTAEALEYFSNMFLNDFDFLAQTGGSYTDDVRVNTMTDYDNMTREERETVIFNLYGVAVYYNNELQFVIDAQGFSYARYVGLVSNATIKKTDPVKQLVNKEEIQELKDKAETLEELSVTVITDNELVKVWNTDKWNEYKDLMKKQLSENNFKLTKSIIQQLPERAGELKVSMYRLLREVDSIQSQFETANLQQGQKVTLFYISDFGGIVNQMVTLDEVTNTKYAQHDKAVKLTFTPRGKRKQYYNYFYSTLIVYEGWLELPTEVLNTVEKSSDFTITKSKYLSCDKKQYDEILQHYEAQGLKPLINTYKPTF